VVPALRHSAPQARPTEKIAVVHTAVQPAAETAVHASGHAAVQPEKPVERPRFRGAGRGSAQPSSRRPASPPKHHSYLGPAPSQHAGNTLGDSKEDLLKEEIDSSKIFSILPAFLFAPFASSNSMSLWVTAFLVIAIVAIVLFLCMLVRFIQDGYEVHWMAGLPARTDWQHLSNGDFVKVVGHVVALPAREVVSPLTRTPCVAYSVSAGRCDSSKSGKKSVMQVKSFCVQDDQGRMILIQGHEAVLYNLTTAKEWNYLAGSVPKEFHSFSPKVDHDAGEFTLLRFREEVLEVGAKVCCVGAVSTLPNPHAPISLRPAYATLMFRDAQIPWSKLEGLSTSDWGKVASSVLVTSYRLGR
jgi:hypothetical protein